MFVSTKGGFVYEVTNEEMEEIRLLTIGNGGNFFEAVETFHKRKNKDLQKEKKDEQA